MPKPRRRPQNSLLSCKDLALALLTAAWLTMNKSRAPPISMRLRWQSCATCPWSTYSQPVFPRAVCISLPWPYSRTLVVYQPLIPQFQPARESISQQVPGHTNTDVKNTVQSLQEIKSRSQGLCRSIFESNLTWRSRWQTLHHKCAYDSGIDCNLEPIAHIA